MDEIQLLLTKETTLSRDEATEFYGILLEKKAEFSFSRPEEILEEYLNNWHINQNLDEVYEEEGAFTNSEKLEVRRLIKREEYIFTLSSGRFLVG